MTPHLPLPSGLPRPEIAARTPMVAKIVTVADSILRDGGREALSMRTLGTELGIKAPSLYKHVDGRAAIEVLLVADALLLMGEALHDALDRATDDPVGPLLQVYRDQAKARPHLYRLTTASDFPRDALPTGLEDWTGETFYRATGEPVRAQALWAFAHGMAILEIDGRFLPGSPLDHTWAQGAAAFRRT